MQDQEQVKNIEKDDQEELRQILIRGLLPSRTQPMIRKRTMEVHRMSRYHLHQRYLVEKIRNNYAKLYLLRGIRRKEE